MPKIKYTGAADEKVFTAKDFKSVEVEDQNIVRFTNEAPIQEVSDAAWEWISSEASGEASSFHEATDEELAEYEPTVFDPAEDPEELAAARAVESAADPATLDGVPPGEGEPGGLPDADTGTTRAKRGQTGRGSSTAGETA